MAVRVGRRTPGPLSGGVDSDSPRGGGATDARSVRASWFGTHPRRVHARGVSARRGPGERAIDLRAGACQTCVVARFTSARSTEQYAQVRLAGSLRDKRRTSVNRSARISSSSANILFTLLSGKYSISIAVCARDSASAADPIAIRRCLRNSIGVPNAYPSTRLHSTEMAARRNWSNNERDRGWYALSVSRSAVSTRSCDRCQTIMERYL